jgi:TCP-1/cpn60 chaperonin family protein
MVDRILEFNSDLVITEKGISGALFRFCWVLFVIECRLLPISNRLCAVLLCQGEHLCPSTRTQVKQQPDRADSRCRDRKSCRRPTRIRHRNAMWAIQHQKDRRRVSLSTSLSSLTANQISHDAVSSQILHLPDGVHHPQACLILLRGPPKDILNEIDRNLADAMSVARNVVFNPTLVPGGGAVEMAISVGLHAGARARGDGRRGGALSCRRGCIGGHPAHACSERGWERHPRPHRASGTAPFTPPFFF